MSTAFSVERSLLSSGTLRLNGDVGYGSDGVSIPSDFLRTTYTSHFNNLSEPSFSLTALRLSSSDHQYHAQRDLQAVSLTSADRIVLGEYLEMRFGSELQTIQFLGRVRAFKPFGSADLHSRPIRSWNTSIRVLYLARSRKISRATISTRHPLIPAPPAPA